MLRTSSRELNVLPTIVQLQPVADFIVVGEMHGSKQNAPLMQELLGIALALQKPVTVAFEWSFSTSELSALRAYIQGGEIPALLPTFLLNSDGRFTYEHILLIQWIRTYNGIHGNIIDVHTFDDSNNSEERERAMADSLGAYKKQHSESVVLVETGNMHARSLPYIFLGTKHTPMVTHLKKDYTVFSIFLQYLRGTVLVEGKSRDVTKAASQQEGPGAYFDAVVEIPFSETAQEPDDLTTITKLLHSGPV